MGQNAMRAVILAVVVLCSLPGCAQFQNPFKEGPAGYAYFFPEPAIQKVSGSGDEITYEYSRLQGNEFVYANRAAERECRAGGKGAQIVSLVAKNAERGWATFVCR